MSRIDSSTPRNTASTVVVPRWALQNSETGLYLYDYAAHTAWTPSISNARIFFNKRRAEADAKILHCDVVLAGSDPEPVSLPIAPRSESSVELLARLIIESSGVATAAGIQKGFSAKGVKHPPLALFNSRKSGSTLALPLLQLSRQSVIEVVRKSDEAFEQFATKGTDRVFQHLAGLRAVVTSHAEVCQ